MQGDRILGTHLVADALTDTNLDSLATVSDFILESVHQVGLTLVHIHGQEFKNGSNLGPDISVIGMLSKSHMSVHTSPEHRLIQVDLYSRKEFNPERIRVLMDHTFKVTSYILWIARRR